MESRSKSSEKTLHKLFKKKKKKAENSTEKTSRVCMGLDEASEPGFMQIMGPNVRPSPRPIFAKYVSPAGL